MSDAGSREADDSGGAKSGDAGGRAGAAPEGMPDSVFKCNGERIVATELARGPWDPNAQHGGAPAALVMRALEQLAETLSASRLARSGEAGGGELDDSGAARSGEAGGGAGGKPDGKPEGKPEGLALSRVTYEFLRPVPLGELQVRAEVARPGRRVRLLEASLETADGVEVVRARALQIQAAVAEAPCTPPAAPPRGPEHGRDNDFRPPRRPMFAPDAIEIRFVSGTFHGRGPATAWLRLRASLVDGEDPSPLQRLAAAGDFGNGISATLSWDDYLFINPDLTLYVEREPVGEWIGLEAQTIITPGGVGTAESVLYDERGRVGRAIQALLVAQR